MTVLKRNGETEEFNTDKILEAVNKAYTSKGKKIDKVVEQELSYIESLIQENPIKVDTIQDKVIQILMDLAPYDVALGYILYRAQHDESREILDRLDYMEKYSKSSENAASSSETDSNANVSMKNVVTLEAEVPKTKNRLIQRARMKRKLNELYPELSNQYEKDINHHIIYIHDEASSAVPKNYCEAVSLYPMLLNKGVGGMDGITPTPANWLDSFCGQFNNLVFLLSAQCKGAVAFGEFFNFFDYFCVKEFGENYPDKEDMYYTTDIVNHRMTISDKIEAAFQTIVYYVNQPAQNRGWQSPFTNISYYDRYYWDALFGEFQFPDGSRPKWERVSYLQKKFMRWFNKERTKAMLTFFVETMALMIDKDGNYLDKEYKDFTAEMHSKGHSFFVYISDNPNSLSSCCFAPETKVLWKSSTQGVQCTTLKELYDTKWDPYKKNLRVFHNGFWIKGKAIRTANTDFYKVTTSNHKTFYMTNNHINVTFDGEKKASELKVGDYLMFNTQPLQATPESDEHLTYEQGFSVGAFLGDGSFGNRFADGTIYEINYSQNEQKYRKCIDMVNKANKQLGGEGTCKMSSTYNNVYPVRISSKLLVAFIQKWINWKKGTYSYNKELNLDCLLQSYEFRRGILDGWYNTDGGNSNRCYTSSEKLKDCMEILITSLGMNSIIDCSDRTDEKVIIREYEYNRNYPLWCVRWYEPCNKTNMPEIYKWKNNSQFFKIIEIEHVGEYPEEKYSYCIECNDTDNPYFTLPSGLITHNCRLRNKIDTNEFSFTNGLSGVKTGSCNVITLNLNRIIQDYFKFFPTDCNINCYLSDKHNGFTFLKKYIIDILERVYKYHIAYKSILYDWEKRGMFTACNEGYINMKDLFCTIGINGLNEAARFLGIKINYNEEYKEFCRFIIGTISEQNKLHTTKEFKFNTEFVPAEGLSSKNYNWDKEDGYEVPEDTKIYNSYFYNAWDPNTSVLDKFKLHGREFTELLDGGVGLHCNLEEHLSKEQYLKLMDFAAANGTSYWTYNIPNSECTNTDCHYIVKNPMEKCPKCGSPMRLWTRVVGFLRPIDGYDQGRYWDAINRFYAKC